MSGHICDVQHLGCIHCAETGNWNSITSIILRGEQEADPYHFYLTNDKKANTLSELKTEIENGDIDMEMVAHLDEFNSIDGVVSTYCCVGHIHEKEFGGYISFIVDRRTHIFLMKSSYNLPSVINSIELDVCYSRTMRWCMRWQSGKVAEAMEAIISLLKESHRRKR